MPTTELRFLCAACGEVAQINEIFIKPDLTLKIQGQCNTCGIHFARDYDLCEVFVRQEEVA